MNNFRIKNSMVWIKFPYIIKVINKIINFYFISKKNFLTLLILIKIIITIIIKINYIYSNK